jgi:DNA-binding NarL/FixJ family response regulator
MKKAKAKPYEQAELIRYLLVIELWRAGLTQGQIAKRLSLSNNTINAMLKGLNRTGIESAIE